MPTFDGSSSRPSQADADLLRGVLGRGRPCETSLRSASRAYHRSQRRAVLRRAIAVFVLVIVFLGSASLMTQKHSAPAAVVAEKLRDPVTTGSIAAPVPRRLARPVSSGDPEDAAERRP
jgi:hypothetical protein